MPIFGLGKKKSGQPRAPRHVLGEGDRVAVKLIQAADAQDWSGIHSTLSGYQDRDLSSLTSSLTSHDATREWLKKVAGENTEDFLSRLILGSCAIDDGWKIRTGYFAQHVSQEQFTAFHAELRVAEDHLYEAARLDSGAAAPWHFLLMSGRGLEVGLAVIERRFEAATRRCPDHFGAHSQMLQCLCKKWSGSHEAMHAFAEEAIRGPYWSTLAPLVVWAHLERFLDLGGGEPGKAYLAQPKVLAEIREAADLTLWQPGYADARAPYALANLFAMAFSLARDWELARDAFEATDWVVTRSPWNYLDGGNQKAPYARFRHFATSIG